MNQIVNIDGTILPADAAKISVFDHGFLFGDSIYETLRTYKRKPFLMDRHLQRLENSARMLHLKIPISVENVRREIHRTIDACSNEECYIRVIITRGVGKISLDVDLCERSSYVIIVDQLGHLPSEYYTQGVKVFIVSIRRNDQATLNPKIKSSNLLNNVLAYIQAKEHGAYEGILCNMGGYITECTGSNVFMIRNGEILTPPPEAGLLEGVTRALTLELAQHEGIPCSERNLTPEELMEAEECFITSTTKEIMPVCCINHTQLSPVPGPFTQALMHSYRRFVEQQ